MKPQRTVAKYWFAHVFQITWCFAGVIWCIMDLVYMIRFGIKEADKTIAITIIIYAGMLFSVWLQIRWGNRVYWERVVKYALHVIARICDRLNRLFPEMT